MSYEKEMGTGHPGFILILLDQSSSMGEDHYGDETKAQFAARIVNNIIYEIGRSSQRGVETRNRCFLGIIGYGTSVKALLGGMISDIIVNSREPKKVKRVLPDGHGGFFQIQREIPIWLKPHGSNGTPMAQAFEEAYETTKYWVKRFPDSFPPIIINITDGELDDNDEIKKTRAIVRKIKKLKTSDGGTLLFQTHIPKVTIPTDHQYILPNRKANMPKSNQFLFDISSILPENLAEAAKKLGFPVEERARGCIFNAEPKHLINFLNFGTRYIVTGSR